MNDNIDDSDVLFTVAAFVIITVCAGILAHSCSFY